MHCRCKIGWKVDDSCSRATGDDDFWWIIDEMLVSLYIFLALHVDGEVGL